MRVLLFTLLIMSAAVCQDSDEDRDSCPDDKRCLKCDGNTCARCIFSFKDANGVCQDADKVDDCKFYSSETQCEECKDGYYLNGNQCVEIDIDDCARVSADDSNVCAVCDDAIVVNNGNCEGEVECSDDNCDLCKSENECVECEGDYSVAPDGKCVKAPIDNCFSVDGDGNCLRCEKGSYDRDGECKSTREQKSGFITKTIGIALLGLVYRVF